MPKRCTVTKAAALLGKSRAHVYRLIKTGDLEEFRDEKGRTRLDSDQVTHVRAKSRTAADWGGRLDGYANAPTEASRTSPVSRANSEEVEAFQREKRERTRAKWAEEDARKKAEAEAQARANEELEHQRNELREELSCFTLEQLREIYREGELEGYEDQLAEVLRPAEVRFVVDGVSLGPLKQAISESRDRWRTRNWRQRHPQGPVDEQNRPQRSALAALSKAWGDWGPLALLAAPVALAAIAGRNKETVGRVRESIFDLLGALRR